MLSATGNSFALVDAWSGGAPDDPAAAARELCQVGGGIDGMLLLLPPRGAGNVRMEIWNADGSRAEMCGNGLRCIARHAVESGYAGESMSIETDSGPRGARVLERHGRSVTVRAEIGQPRVVERRAVLEAGGARHEVALVDLGNPHCVLFVPDERLAPVHELGPLLERHPRFPRGTNVEFAAPRGHQLGLRVWERGVGETRSCGTGASAAAAVAILEGRAQAPLEIEVPGGWLLAEWDGSGPLWLTGSTEEA
jgi:diaminopimelate epimerase